MSRVLLAFVAGVLSFATPCVLPLVPGYLAALTGSVPGEGGPGSGMRALRAAIPFVIGFGAVFTALGVLAGLLGSAMQSHRDELTMASGILVVAIGFALLGLIPVPALERMAGFVEATAKRQGIENPLNMTICASDGEQLVAVRYSSEGNSRSLFHSTSFRHLHELYPDDPRITAAGEDAYLIVSEPLVDLPDVWAEVPEATAIVVRGPQVDYRQFVPVAPQ